MPTRLRCLRCGDWYNPATAFCDDRCGECEAKLDQILVRRGSMALLRAAARYRRNTERHPTVLALPG